MLSKCSKWLFGACLVAVAAMSWSGCVSRSTKAVRGDAAVGADADLTSVNAELFRLYQEDQGDRSGGDPNTVHQLSGQRGAHWVEPAWVQRVPHSANGEGPPPRQLLHGV
jgi:hypothetical protein